ncbi:MAG TPA: NAD(P)-dependent alcohol dehydrogenase [Myxococcota bacterium]
MAQKSWKRGTPLELIELPDPQPKADEVRVRVTAAGVNPVDYKLRSFGPLRLAARLIGPPPPIVVGVDFAGVIDAVGSKVTGFAVGDRVCGGTVFSRGQRGSAADTVCVRDDQITRIADTVDDDTAACLSVVGVTAKLSLDDVGHLPRGGKVLVLGASGGVGQFTVQLARVGYDATVVGVCSAKNEALVQSLGAHHTLDYAGGDVLARAKAFGPFDVVVEAATGYSASACRALLKPGGRHAIVTGEKASTMAQVLVPPFSSRLILGEPRTKHLQPLMQFLADGRITIRIAETMPLTELQRAHDLSAGGRLTGKLVVKP